MSRVKLKCFIVALMLMSVGYGDQRQLWLETLKSSEPQEQERLLAEGVHMGWKLPDFWLELWKTESLRYSILQGLEYENISKLPPLEQWSPSLRMQAWLRALQQNWGEDDLLAKAKNFLPQAGGQEKELLNQVLKIIPSTWSEDPKESDSIGLCFQKWSIAQQQGNEAIARFKKKWSGLTDSKKILLPQALEDTDIEQLCKSQQSSIVLLAHTEKWKRNFDWTTFLSFLKAQGYFFADGAVAILNQIQPEIKADFFKKIWIEQDEAGRLAIAIYLTHQNHLSLSDVLGEAFLNGQSSSLCLDLLRSIGPHEKSDWLLDQLIAKKTPADLTEKVLITLLEWDEVKSDRRYVQFFLDGNYRLGGEGMVPLMLLLGKSQHSDADRIIASHFKESEKNPYDILTVVEASAYHGSDKLVSQIKASEQKMDADFFKWAMDRSERKITSNWETKKVKSAKPSSSLMWIK